jgi:hypothetical protein
MRVEESRETFCLTDLLHSILKVTAELGPARLGARVDAATREDIARELQARIRSG